MMKAKDSVRIWFETLSSMGEDMDILLQCDVGEGMQDYRFHHGRFDAIGGFLTHVAKVDKPKTTLSLRGKGAPFYKYLIGFFIYLLRIPFYASGFKNFNKNWRSSKKHYPRAVSFLDVTETRAIKERAQAMNVSVNAFLLYHLNASFQELLNGKGKDIWLIPVNLRVNTKDNLSQNEVGFVDAVIKKHHGVFDINQQIKKRLSRYEHLGGVLGVGIGVVTGEFLLKKLVKLNKYLQVRTGVFTNLGEWQADGCEHFKLSGFPPVLETQPVGASAITWCHKMTLSLHTHPALQLNESNVEKILENWKNRLKE